MAAGILKNSLSCSGQTPIMIYERPESSYNPDREPGNGTKYPPVEVRLVKEGVDDRVDRQNQDGEIRIPGHGINYFS